MPLLRNRKRFCQLLLMIILGILSFLVSGAEFSAEIKQGDIAKRSDEYFLSVNIDYHLSEKAKTALQNGVPLYWNLLVKVKKSPDFFWDKTWLKVAKRYQLQYHALLNMYRVKNEDNGEVHSFSSLSSALELMSVIIDLPLINKALLDPEHQYLCLIKLDFKRDDLPLPLRPFAYIDPQWYLSSEWTSWPLKK